MPVLRCHQRDRVTLILDELRRREVPGATELLRICEGRGGTFNRLGQHDLLDLRPVLAASDLRTKTEQLISIGQHNGVIDRSEAGDCR